METPRTDEDTLQALIACPEIYTDEIGNMDFPLVREYVAEVVLDELRRYGGYGHPDQWKQATPADLAAKIASTVTAGIGVPIERQMHRNFLGALDLIQERRAAAQDTNRP